MKFFVNCIDPEKIKELYATNMLNGINTNPSILASSPIPAKELLSEITKIVFGPVSVEVTASDYKGMMAEADALRKISRNILIKVPASSDGLRACKDLTSSGTLVTVTLCFDCVQAILAAKAKATYVSPFLGRLEKKGGSSMGLLKSIREIYDQYPEFNTQIIAASVHSHEHIVEAASYGAEAITISAELFSSLFENDMTAEGISNFRKDWEKSGQSFI